MPQTNLRPDFNSPGEAIARLADGVAKSPGVQLDNSVEALQPMYYRSVLSKFDISPNSQPWSVGAILDVLVILQLYFNRNPSTMGMQMSISRNNGHRAFCTIQPLQTRHINSDVSPWGPSHPNSDRIDIYFYTEESIPESEFDTLLDAYRVLSGSRTATRGLTPGRSYAYQSNGLQISFETLYSSAETTTMTWIQLDDAMHTIMDMLDDEINACILFTAELLDKNRLKRGKIEILKVAPSLRATEVKEQRAHF